MSDWMDQLEKLRDATHVLLLRSGKVNASLAVETSFDLEMFLPQLQEVAKLELNDSEQRALTYNSASSELVGRVQRAMEATHLYNQWVGMLSAAQHIHELIITQSSIGFVMDLESLPEPTASAPATDQLHFPSA